MDKRGIRLGQVFAGTEWRKVDDDDVSDAVRPVKALVTPAHLDGAGMAVVEFFLRDGRVWRIAISPGDLAKLACAGME